MAALSRRKARRYDRPPMNEADWQGCESPYPMLAFLEAPDDGTPRELRFLSGGASFYGRDSNRVSPRKLRMFIAACARRLWRLKAVETSRAFLDLLDHYANGEVSRRESHKACNAILEASRRGEGCAVINHWARKLWTEDPIGAARCASDVAWTTAWTLAAESVAVTCAHFTDEDWWEA
jgi:hypothetical protein